MTDPVVREFLLGFWKIHILHHAEEQGVRAMDAGGIAAARLPTESRHVMPVAGENGSSRMAACDGTQAIA